MTKGNKDSGEFQEVCMLFVKSWIICPVKWVPPQSLEIAEGIPLMGNTFASQGLKFE